MIMKKLLVFCLALNIFLIMALVFVFVRGRIDIKKREKDEENYLQSVRREAIEMLAYSDEMFRDGNDFEARTRLDRVRARCEKLAQAETSKIIAMGDICFFDKKIYEGDIAKEKYSLFCEAVKSLINGEELRADEEDIIENIKIVYENSDSEIGLYPSLSSRAEIDRRTALGKAESLLGEKVVLMECENTLFPMCYVFSGKNTFAVISKNGGKLIKLYFYLENWVNLVGEDDARDKIDVFLAKEGLIGLNIISFKEREGGGYSAKLSNHEKSEAIVMIEISGSGRVYMFDAESFYRHYGG